VIVLRVPQTIVWAASNLIVVAVLCSLVAADAAPLPELGPRVSGVDRPPIA
jgi:hypothetical protein